MSGETRFFNAKKGGNNMECNHGRIKSVNCRIFCDICGVELPADYVPGKSSPAPDNAAETPKEGQETPKKARRKTRGAVNLRPLKGGKKWRVFLHARNLPKSFPMTI